MFGVVKKSGELILVALPTPGQAVQEAAARCGTGDRLYEPTTAANYAFTVYPVVDAEDFFAADKEAITSKAAGTRYRLCAPWAPPVFVPPVIVQPVPGEPEE